MKIPKPPKITIKELKKTNPDAAHFMDIAIRLYIEKTNATKLNLGLEKTIEATEELFDKGYLKMETDKNYETFTLKIWNPITGKYQ